MSDVVYDTGALIAADRNDCAFWADHRIRLGQGTIPVAPAAVVAQISRSPSRPSFGDCFAGVTWPTSTKTPRTVSARFSPEPAPPTSPMLYPVFFGSAVASAGITGLVDGITSYFPLNDREAQARCAGPCS